MTALASMAPVASSSKPEQGVLDDLMPTDEDLLYEEELLRNPYSLKMWWRYIQARSEVAAKRRYLLYERALKALPGSYKLWHSYLSERRTSVRGLRPDHPSLTATLRTYERALVSMHKMPRIWIEYLELLVATGAVTAARRAFDKALAALPITQHDRIWVLYLKFVRQEGMPPETAVRVYRRYLKLEPAHVEEYISYCKAHEMWGEAAKRLAQVLDNDTFRSLEGKSKHSLWLELCDIITRHPRDVQGLLSVDAILRGGIRKFTDEVGRLWTSLADYYIRLSLFERARDVYEEGLGAVTTVRDFGLVFDALTHFEESLLAAKLANDEGDEEGSADDGDDDGADFLLKDNGDDTDLRLERLEALAKRRPELLSSVMLRQNPHNVGEWHKRVKLFEGQPTKQILTYTEAVKTVDIDKALGKPHSLWVAFARFYERHGDVANARVIFDKAVQVQYKYVDDLATVWCEWAEMELRHANYKSALELLQRATASPPRTKKLTQEEERQLPVQQRLYRSVKLWALYADLQESLGSFESTCAVYDRTLELRIATPQTVLNYTVFLQEHKHWEDSFRVYERGVSLFKYPHVEDIWAAYLSQFVARYGGTKLERARDLYEQAIASAPPAKATPLFLQYAALEETHGLARHAMEIYARALGVVPKEQRLGVVDVYAARASDFFGVAKVREVYEAAIEAQPPGDLPPDAVRSLCLRYAQLERKLGEIDRARSILVHGSHLANPRVDKGYWDAWNEFEVRHGNEDTFRDMLRIKRSVAASYSQIHIDSAAKVAEITPGTDAGGIAGTKRGREEDSMQALEASLAGGTKLAGFVSAGVIQQGNQEAPANGDGAAAAAAANPEEMDLGDDEEEGAGEQQEGANGTADEEEGEDAALEQKAVPAAVFGSLAAQAGDGGGGQQGEQLGALERFKKRKLEGS